MNKNNSPKELIILLHGILRSDADMLLLQNFFKSNGYDTLNIRYPSREKSLEALSDFVHDKISKYPQYNTDTPIHFVTHSMGGLIARYYITRRTPKNLGKVVMLGPPNKGSEFADWLSETEILAPAFQAIYGPAGQQMTTGYEHIDDDITYPLGVIAGNVSINPLAPWILNGEHDGIVAVERTKIDGMSDHIVMSASHSFMMFNTDIMTQALYFIHHNEFNRNAS
ncbi:MAG: esterase/lipase family protein [Alphaproteobacteria bacterium]